MIEAATYDLCGADFASFKANAHAVYRRMRAHDPVTPVRGVEGHLFWLVTRYDDVERVLRDDRHFARDPFTALTPEQHAGFPVLPPVIELINNHMLNKDGDDHRRLRGLVGKAFTPRVVDLLAPRIQAIADALLDEVQPHGVMDLIDDYAFPLPIIVIAELLGIPPADRDRFRVYSDVTITPPATPEAQQRFVTLMIEFTDYLRQLFARRRREPRDDLITALLRVEELGDRLSETELFSLVVLLIVAGHETTVNLIANSTLALLENPAQLARLRDDPALATTAVEELLRYDGPVEQALIRWATEDLELAGQRIRRGEPVVAVLAAANRDPACFPEPDRLDLTREPNRHLGFGKGVHYCLGAPLARLEGAIAIRALVQRLPGLRLAASVDTLTWRLSPLIRGLKALPVAWSSATPEVAGTEDRA